MLNFKQQACNSDKFGLGQGQEKSGFVSESLSAVNFWGQYDGWVRLLTTNAIFHDGGLVLCEEKIS